MQVYEVRTSVNAGGQDLDKGDVLVVDYNNEVAWLYDNRFELNTPTLDYLKIHGYLDRIS
jgi:hypothetical protein